MELFLTAAAFCIPNKVDISDPILVYLNKITLNPIYVRLRLTPYANSGAM